MNRKQQMQAQMLKSQVAYKSTINRNAASLAGLTEVAFNNLPSNLKEMWLFKSRLSFKQSLK